MYIQLNTYLKHLAVVSLLCCSSIALAVDGVIEINQTRALAGGVTPGDTPGYPVTLSQSGSYRLTGNLTLTDKDMTGIEITANDVSVDLNGFGIFGVVECSYNGTATNCVPSDGAGYGIVTPSTDTVTPAQNASVVNGTIRGMGSSGIDFRLGGRIHAITSISNRLRGISCSPDCIIDSNIVNYTGGGIGLKGSGTVRGNTAKYNHTGIEASGSVSDNVANNNENTGISAEGVVSSNTAVSNGKTGISASGIVSGNNSGSNGGLGFLVAAGSLVSNNTAHWNNGYGLRGTLGTAYSNNTFAYNNGGNTNDQVFGPLIQIGTNLCGDDTTCP